MVAVLTVALACFALGVWQPFSPYELEEQIDVKGNSTSGLFNPATEDFEGQVHILFANGEVYDGGLEGHRFNGTGTFCGVLSSEDTAVEGQAVPWRFEGTFINGRLEGEGSYSDHLGSYVGNFSNSLPSGYGVYTSLSGWSYDGEFVAGMMTGKGTVVMPNGTTITGTFLDGVQAKEEQG